MSLVIFEGVKKHFAAHEVLAGATFRIDPGQKLGLVGRNGGGKTTILRLLVGEEQPDWGSVTLRKGVRVRHVEQRPKVAAATTVREFVESGLVELRTALRDYEESGEQLGVLEGEALERELERHDALLHEIEALGGFDGERRVEEVLSGIGLHEGFWERDVNTLSGGERSRACLAKALVAGSELLVLDEPTHHLDLAGIAGLEEWIKLQQGAVLIVSHDRRLLNNAVDSILELERGALTRYPGNYDQYLRIKEERYAADLRAYENQQDFIRKEDAFVRQHMGSHRVTEAKGRQKKLEALVRVAKPFHDVRRPVIRPPAAERGGETVLEARDLSGGYGGTATFEDANFRVARSERIGIVGRNGAGKTTLMKILAGRMQPLAGEVALGHKAQVGYYDQDTSALRDDGTPYYEMRRAFPQLEDQEIRDHLARFLFRGVELDSPIAGLSGGERARLCLAKLVLGRPSWLAMDEPTNHLDLAARTALEEMLSAFEGSLVVVSHDREFLDGLCNVILEVDGGRVLRHEGNYTEWRAKKQAQRDSEREAARAKGGKPQPKAAQKQAATVAIAPPPAKAAPTKPTAAATDEARAQGGKQVRNPLAFAKLEARIMELEKQLTAARDELERPEAWRDPAKLKETQMRAAELEQELSELNDKWANW